jgi:hypothetical protein
MRVMALEAVRFGEVQHIERGPEPDARWSEVAGKAPTRGNVRDETPWGQAYSSGLLVDREGGKRKEERGITADEKGG